MARIGINDGHTLSGIGSGAVGFLNESQETRKLGNAVRRNLSSAGHTVFNYTVDKASTVNESLKLVTDQANREDLDLFVAIHLNASGGVGYGAEVYTYKGRQYADALKVCANLETLGFRNRGVKVGTGLYVINKTTAKSMLIEVCFCDNQNDANLYNQLGIEKIAKAISDAILETLEVEYGKPVVNTPVEEKPTTVVDTKKETIKLGQQHSINFTGRQIVVDGINGPDTKKNAALCVQRALNCDYGAGLEEDCIFGVDSKNKLKGKCVGKGDTQFLVTALEILLMLKGYDPHGVECPGKFGSGLEACLEQYQKDNNLKVDKLAGYNTFCSLLDV